MNILVTIFLLLLAELLCFIAYSYKSGMNPVPYYYSHIDFVGQKWISKHPIDYSGFKYNFFWGAFPGDYSSETINVKNGYRESSPPESNGINKVYCFGGSTMWGEGVSDQLTIPSFLNKNNVLKKYIFFNYGVQSYTAEQQIFNLTKILLDSNEKSPDYVIFYDGANNIAADIAPLTEINNELISGKFSYLIYRLYKKTYTSKAIDSLRAKFLVKKNINQSAYILNENDIDIVDKSVNKYLQQISYTKKILDSFQINSYFFLQPYLLSGLEFDAGLVSESEKNIYLSVDERSRKMTALFYQKVKSRLPSYVRDLSDIFVRKNISGHYYDSVHLTHIGNKLVADEIAVSFK